MSHTSRSIHRSIYPLACVARHSAASTARGAPSALAAAATGPPPPRRSARGRWSPGEGRGLRRCAAATRSPAGPRPTSAPGEGSWTSPCYRLHSAVMRRCATPLRDTAAYAYIYAPACTCAAHELCTCHAHTTHTLSRGSESVMCTCNVHARAMCMHVQCACRAMCMSCNVHAMHVHVHACSPGAVTWPSPPSPSCVRSPQSPPSPSYARRAPERHTAAA